MHPITLSAFIALREHSPHHPLLSKLKRGHHFEISKGIAAFALETAKHEYVGWDLHGRQGHPPMPSTARLPGDVLSLVFSDGAIFVLSKINHTEIATEFLTPNGTVIQIGAFDPNKQTSWSLPASPIRSNKERQEDFAALYHIAFVVALINLPRKVVHTPETVSRQHRRRVIREVGCPSVGYSRVAWEVGSSVRAHGRSEDSEGGVALHWSRAHFRHAVAGEPKAEWLNLPGKGGWGWYTWVSDSWKGHPSFGVKLQAHAPRFTGELPHSGAVLPAFTASSSERLAMLETQKAEAIRQAGLAA